MTLRLVLVSLVAALGLTIPGTSMIESWVASSQNWMNARFADWDTRNPPSADYVIVSDYYDSARFSSRWDSNGVPELKVVSEKVAAREVRHTSSHLNTRPKAALSVSEERFTPIRQVSLTRPRIDFQPIDVTVGWHRGIALELNRRHDGTGLRASREVASTAVPCRFEPLAILEPLRTLVDELNVRNEGIGIVSPKRFDPKVASRARFEPISVPEHLQVGVAYELNRCSEDIGAIAVAAFASSNAGSSQSSTDPRTMSLSFSALELDPHLYFAGEPITAIDQGASRPAVGSRPAPQEETSSARGVTASTATVSPPSDRMPPGLVAVRELSENLEERTVEVAEELLPAEDGFGLFGRRSSRLMKSVEAAERGEDVEELAIEVAGELLPADDGFGLPGQRSPWLTNGVESADPMKRFDSRVADEPSILVEPINRQDDGRELSVMTAAAPAPSVASSSRPGRSLSRAVELTRDAVYAWVNVLTGPALVTVTSSR